MSATGRGALRHPDDYYATPEWCTRAILPHLGSPRSILEPAAGEGAILRECRAQWPGARAIGIEIDPERAAACDAALGDFLQPGSVSGEWDLIITNPPYALARAFIERALPLASEVCMLLRLNFLASQERANLWREHPAGVYVLPRRPSFVKSYKCTEKGCDWRGTSPPKITRWKQCPVCGGKVRTSSSDATEYAWFVWGPRRGNRWQILDIPANGAQLTLTAEGSC